MGMYATICGEQVKFTGMLATAAFDNGVVTNNGMVTITRRQATGVLTSFASSMEKGQQLIEGRNIQGRYIYNLARDARVLATLFDWVVRSSEKAIHFI